MDSIWNEKSNKHPSQYLESPQNTVERREIRIGSGLYSLVIFFILNIAFFFCLSFILFRVEFHFIPFAWFIVKLLVFSVSLRHNGMTQCYTHRSVTNNAMFRIKWGACMCIYQFGSISIKVRKWISVVF